MPRVLTVRAPSVSAEWMIWPTYGILFLFLMGSFNSVDSLDVLVDSKLPAPCDATLQMFYFLCEAVTAWVDCCSGPGVSRDVSVLRH